jgi:hypothetical protein
MVNFTASGGFLSQFASMLGGAQAPSAPAKKAKKKKATDSLPKFEIPEWMKNPPTLPDVSDATLPSVPVPDPLAKLSVTSGEEARLRRKRKGIKMAVGAGETGGWMA